MSLSVESLNNLRTRIAAGEDVPPDEVRAALLELRQKRTELSEKPSRSRAKTPRVEVNIDNLLDF